MNNTDMGFEICLVRRGNGVNEISSIKLFQKVRNTSNHLSNTHHNWRILFLLSQAVLWALWT